MSLTVIAIAAVPAALVATVAAKTQSRPLTTIAATAALLIGVWLGNPSYMAIDIAAVTITTFLFWPKRAAAVVPASTAKANGRGVKIIIWLLFVTAVVWMITVSNSNTPPSSTATVQPTPLSIPAPNLQQGHQPTPQSNAEPPQKLDNYDQPRSTPSSPGTARSLKSESSGSSTVINDGYRLLVVPNDAIRRPCEFKAVMADEDYRACGIKPPQP